MLAQHPILAATARRFGRRREMYLGLIVLGAIAIQAGQIAISVASWPANEFKWFPRNNLLWKRSTLNHAGGQSAIIRRPLWCGAVYLALPADRVVEVEHGYEGCNIPQLGIVFFEYDDVELQPGATPPPGRPVYQLSSNGVAWTTRVVLDTWRARIYPGVASAPVSTNDSPLVRSAVEAGDEYTELLVVGWPWRVASLTATNHLTGANGGQGPVLHGARLPMRFGPPSPHYPNELLNFYPLHFRIPALIASLLLWASIIASAIVGPMLVSSGLRRWRGRCPACAFQVDGCGSQCPECGLMLNP